MQCILFDRDGTLIKDKHYLSDPEGVELIFGAEISLQHLYRAGYRFALVSNQSGIGRGFFNASQADACNNVLIDKLLLKHDAFLDLLYCLHAPEEKCECRKPAIGMWKILQERHALDPNTTTMVGDKKEDIQFAINANVRYAFLVGTGKGAVLQEALGIPSFFYSTEGEQKRILLAIRTMLGATSSIDDYRYVVNKLLETSFSPPLYYHITKEYQNIWGSTGVTEIYAIPSVAFLDIALACIDCIDK